MVLSHSERYLVFRAGLGQVQLARLRLAGPDNVFGDRPEEPVFWDWAILTPIRPAGLSRLALLHGHLRGSGIGGGLAGSRWGQIGSRLLNACSVRGTRRRENGWADGLTGGALRAGLGQPTKYIRRAAPGAGLGRFRHRAPELKRAAIEANPTSSRRGRPPDGLERRMVQICTILLLGGKRPRCCG